MMTGPQIESYLNAAPFRPFRLHMASGKTFDIRHPEMIKIGKSFLFVFFFTADQNNYVDQWETVSLMLIEYISHLDVPVSA